MVAVSPWIVHRHEGLWERPDEFDPARFCSEAGLASAKQAYLPFGLGPRACPGAAFATQESLLILAQLVRRYRIEPAPGPAPMPSCWTIKASSETQGETETRYTFLRWDDIVRDNWPASKGAVIAAMLSFYRVYASHGIFAATRKVALRTFWTMMSPAIYAVLLLALAGGLGVMLAGGITQSTQVKNKTH